MDKCERNFVGGLVCIFLIILLLLPLIATSLVFLGSYLPIIEETDIAVQSNKISRSTTSYSLQDALFDGTAARNLSLTTQVFSVLIPILVYTLHCTEWKIFTRSTLLGLLSLAQPLLLALVLARGSVQNIPYCKEKLGGCDDNYPPAERCLVGAAFLTPLGSLVTTFMMQSIVDNVKRSWAAAATDTQPSGEPEPEVQQTRKQNKKWEAAREKAEQDVVDDATQAVESGESHFLSLATLNNSATFQSTDSTVLVLGMETRTVSKGVMTFHHGLERDCLRPKVLSITGYGNNRDGSFIIMEGQLSVWSGKAYWVTQAPSSKIQTLVTGTFTRGLPNADNAGTMTFAGSFVCDNTIFGEFKSFALHPKNEEPATADDPDLEMGIEPTSTADVASSDQSGSDAPEEGLIACSVLPVDSDVLPNAASLPIAQAEIFPKTATKAP